MAPARCGRRAGEAAGSAVRRSGGTGEDHGSVNPEMRHKNVSEGWDCE
jgi:hypothetical protein